jgi:GNAT superfamily N-acetyltransferase
VDLVRALRLGALADAPSAYATTLEQAASLGDEEWRERLQPDRHPTFVWEDDEGAHGMVVGVIDGDDATLVHLFAMWVRPSARGAGVGGDLVAHVLAWARRRVAAVVRLHVTAGNDVAERLYARHGFVRTGRTRVRERDGLVELEMEARIAPPGPERR